MSVSLRSCPNCESYNLKVIIDYEINYMLFKCTDCHESFAVDRVDLVNNGIDWAFGEWHRAYRIDSVFNRVKQKMMRCFQ